MWTRLGQSSPCPSSGKARDLSLTSQRCSWDFFAGTGTCSSKLRPGWQPLCPLGQKSGREGAQDRALMHCGSPYIQPCLKSTSGLTCYTRFLFCLCLSELCFCHLQPKGNQSLKSSKGSGLARTKGKQVKRNHSS